MAILLDGKKARDFYAAQLAERAGRIKNALGRAPRLAIIQIGDRKESGVYIAQKKKFGVLIGVEVDHIRLPEDVSESEVRSKIAVLNADGAVDGIIMQLPVPEGLDRLPLLNAIDPKKDVDGLTDANQALLASAAEGTGVSGLIPATAKGVLLLLNFYSIPVKGKKAVVFGRSRLVGGPLAALLKIEGAASVAVCHSQTKDPETVARAADLVVVAIGKPRHIGPAFIRKGAVVVDVGINSVPGGKLVGDVDFDAVSPIAEAISPVPGGVGPMTVLALFDNLIDSAEKVISS